jgi:hypothetical protein
MDVLNLFLQISPCPWEFLEFDKLELNFSFEINKQTACSLQLTIVRDDCVAFDIETTNILHCSMEPSRGIVPPRSKCDVMVTLQARECATVCRDEFVVRCTAVNEGLTAGDITKQMFGKKTAKMVDEVTLMVVICPISIT